LMRKFACCYAQGKPGARYFRTHVAHVRTADEFLKVVEDYFPTSETLLVAESQPSGCETASNVLSTHRN
jgi:tRNA-dihydrouridine synthase B